MTVQENGNKTAQLEAAVGLYSDMLLRVSLNMLGNLADTEDAVQETYLRYMRDESVFESAEHEKAWLLRVCINVCRNIRKSRTRRNFVDIDDIADLTATSDDRPVMTAIMSLPEKYRTVFDLHYVEGYDTDEVASILGIKPAAVRKRLQLGRKLLKTELEG